MNTPTFFITTEQSPSKREIVGKVLESQAEAEALFYATPAPTGGMLRLTRRDHEAGENFNTTLLTKYPS